MASAKQSVFLKQSDIVFRSLLECSLGYNHDSDRCVIDCSDALHLSSRNVIA